MSRREIVVLSILLLIGAIALSFLFAGGAFWLYDLLPDDIQRASWTNLALNVIAPGLAGVSLTLLLPRAPSNHDGFLPSLLAHLLRTFPLYLFAIFAFAVIYSQRNESDFGLWVQVIIWPLVSVIAALLADGLISVWRSRCSPVGAPKSVV